MTYPFRIPESLASQVHVTFSNVDGGSPAASMRMALEAHLEDIVACASPMELGGRWEMIDVEVEVPDGVRLLAECVVGDSKPLRIWRWLPDPDAELVEDIARCMADNDAEQLEQPGLVWEILVPDLRDSYRVNAWAVLAHLRARFDLFPRRAS